MVKAVNNNLKKHEINLQRTTAATKRSNPIIARAELFLLSLGNPGKIALYSVAALAAGYTLYSIFRYGELPLTSLFRAASQVASAGSSAVSEINKTNQESFNFS